MQVTFRLAGILGGCYAFAMRVWRYFLISVFICVAWLARLYGIENQSIWFDEGWSAYAAVQPTLAAAIAADPTNPPLYYVLLNVTVRVFGDSPFGLRVTSALLGLLTIPLAYVLGRDLFGKRAGFYAALLVAVSSPLWWAAQEARMYTLLAVLVLVAAIAWHRLLTRPTRVAWVLLLLAEILLLYAHNTGPVIVLWLNVMTLLAWVVRWTIRRPDWRGWLLGQALVGLLWLPWFVDRFINVQAANSAIASGPQLNMAFVGRIWQAFWVAPWDMIGREPVMLGFAVAAGVLTVGLVRWRQSHAWWLVGHGLVLVAGMLVGLSLIGNELHGRYLVMVVPLLLVAVGAGIARLSLALLRYGAVAVFGALFIANLVLAQNPLYQHDDVRGMVQYYADALTAEDTVVAWSYADRYDLAYYWDRLDVQAQRVTLPEGADWPQVAPLLPASGRVALNRWYTQRADYRDMLPCMLGHGTVNAPDEFTTYGMTNLLYETPGHPLVEPQVMERPVLHNGQAIAHIETVGSLPKMTADQAICLPVQLRLDQLLSVDLRAAVVVRNDLGWDVAQASGIFATANQRTTAHLPAGETVSAYVLLRLPYGAPTGDYTVFLRVFDDAAEPSGYDMVTADGRLLGKDLPLGAWSVLPGADWSQVERETELPYTINKPVSDDLTLLAHNLEPEIALLPGQTLRLQLLWQGPGPLLDLTLVSDDDFEMVIPAENGPRDLITLDWRELRLPADAPGGTAQLLLPDGSSLATINIDSLPRLDTAPDYAVAVDLALGDMGTLVGYTPPDEAVTRDGPLPVTLVWQAGDVTPTVSYTVFVQLLDAEGRLIAQSDSIPALGERPTTSWRTGEYILDPHQLRFNELAGPGEARLIAGLYDSVTRDRVVVGPDGQDYLELPGTITLR